MDREEMRVIESRDAKEIKDYCHELGYQLGLPRVCVHWWVEDVQPRPDDPYKLVVDVEPLGTPWFHFTRDAIEGYSTGVSTARIQDQIRADLDARLAAARRRSA